MYFTYNSDRFEIFYENMNSEVIKERNISKNLKENVDKKQEYINENIKSLKFFIMKSFTLLFVNLLLIILNLYMINKLKICINKYKEITKYNNVIYDEKSDVTTGGYMTFEEYKKMREKNK